MPTALKLNGKSFSPSGPIIPTIQAFLEKQPPTELFTYDRLSDLCGVSLSTLKGSRTLYASPELEKYTLKIRRARYWGHPKAIVALRKQVGL